MKTNYIILAVILLLTTCKQEKKMTTKAIDVKNMDLSVNPGDDFNQYANGGWIKNHPVPDDKSRYGTFDQLGDENDKKLKTLIDEIAGSTHKDGSIAQKIATFYNSGMDTTLIEQQGIKDIEPELNKIEKIETTDDIQKQIEHFNSFLIYPGFILFGGADAKNSEMKIAQLYQGGLGLPDRDYYLNDNEHFAKIRTAYIDHIKNIFILSGMNKDSAGSSALTVFNFEKKLAEGSMDKLLLRDPNKTYHKMSVSELQNIAPTFDWSAYLSNIGLEIQEINVAQPDFIKTFNTLLAEETVDTWKTYFKWQMLHSSAPYLNSSFVEENFNFYGKVLSGTPQMKPRWKRVLNTTNGLLGEAVGQVYVAKYFPPASKERMLKLVENLRLAFADRIKQLSWMEEQTKDSALNKLNAITVKIGYPDKWKDYSTLNLNSNSYIINAIEAKKFNFKEMIGKIGKPVDKTEWHMPPQIVNAYYNPSQNEIVFPAGILQPPFFYADGDDAVNYGAIGVVIGHEMTHGFDDKGRLYDKNGNLNSWWTEEDAKRFKERTDVLVKQYDNFIVLDSIKANGSYTLGENIADLGGVNIAYTAFLKTEQGKHKDKKNDGFTGDQRFFLAYAHIWAQTIRDEEILRRTQEDVHSLGKYRVIGPLRNVEPFMQAFNIKEGDYMYLPENERAIIW